MSKRKTAVKKPSKPKDEDVALYAVVDASGAPFYRLRASSPGVTLGEAQRLAQGLRATAYAVPVEHVGRTVPTEHFKDCVIIDQEAYADGLLKTAWKENNAPETIS